MRRTLLPLERPKKCVACTEKRSSGSCGSIAALRLGWTVVCPCHIHSHSRVPRALHGTVGCNSCTYAQQLIEDRKEALVASSMLLMT